MMADTSDTTTAVHFLAIDVAKQWNAVLIETATGTRHRFKMANTAQDFDRLIQFIHGLGGQCRAALEPTGNYHRPIAHRLITAGVDLVNRLDPSTLISARLAPDMMIFAGQIQRASDTSKGAIARLTTLQAPSFSDTETTFAGLKARIRNTQAFLETVRPQDMADSAQRSVELKFLNHVFSGTDFILEFTLPNFFFHVATAHDILRHNSVQIGKKHYLGHAA